ncbi:MAG: AraC family transcriptional regulator [Treponema sp.]|uniref:AraC family transcriptional regulator n=1 Tax=Treponema sp. TaxID=166 RepID=UPI00298DAD7B|nr:AraC family transcriptional regulator [Treponema sp.]MCI5695897.1 helix-turn-helix domain-containing protein [Spirochaetia bacterium]MDD5812539.1 AraC family transcriptional regulator [Treponema sp.]MDY5884875.1 AraC family transcriptional regulator [Treponema sp.]
MIDSKKKEIVQRGTAFFPIQYYWNNTDAPLYNLPVHWHLDYEIIHVVEGRYKMILGGSKIILNKDDYCIIQDGVLHGDDENIESCKYESIVFNYNLIRIKNFAQDSFLNDIAEHRVVLNRIIRFDDHFIKREVDYLFDSLKKQDSGFELRTTGLLFCLFGYIKQKQLYSEDEKVLDKNKIRTEQMKTVLKLISENYNQQITLEDMAEKAGMSPKYFCRVFKETTHRTPIEYLNAYRVDQACSLLRSSDESLINISLNCGFNDFSYFIKIFKKYKGMTPHKYRNYDTRNTSDDELFFNHEQYFQSSPY